MQYHLNGFRKRDPSVVKPTSTAESAQSEVDVLIVGCGPAGLTLAAQLCAFDGPTIRIAEHKSGPLEMGQADGIACRSVEMYQAFGFTEKATKEGYWVNEITLWRPGADGTALARADRIEDVEGGLSEMLHVIPSQARIHDFYFETMAKSTHRLSPNDYRALLSVTRHSTRDFPIEAVFDCSDATSQRETIHAKFLVGCDGARSKVREAMGHELKGDSTQQLWGVMDVLPRTNFPVIRLKCATQSADAGSILIIQHEGGYMVRLYIELDELRERERAKDRGVTSEQLVAKAQEIFAPFTFDAAEIAWWSAYEIGQRVCDSFDDVAPNERGEKTPHMFIAGDACHTRSPKAGQGMNVSMADDPSALARNFMDLTGDLLFRADWARISEVSKSADLKRLSRRVLDPAPAWKSAA